MNNLSVFSLHKALSDFKGVTDIKDESTKIEALEKQFTVIAKAVFFGGYFLVNGKRKISPIDIEFYYHEEYENGLKDPAMYHTSDHEQKEKPLKYYPLGLLNFHISGLDVTFENENDKYRASFLIRAYSTDKLSEETWVPQKREEKRSTYIYEDMLMGESVFSGIKIEWITDIKEVPSDWKPKMTSRINIASYEKDKQGRFKKDEQGKFIKEFVSKNEYEQMDKAQRQHYFCYSGNRYKKCTRKWNYHK